MIFFYLSFLARKVCVYILNVIVLFSVHFLISIDANAQNTCPDPGGGHRFINIDRNSTTRNFYPGIVPSGQSGIEKATAGYVKIESSRNDIYANKVVTLIPQLPNGATGSVVLKFDILDIGVANTFLSIYYGSDTSGTPVATINTNNAASYLGTTLVHNGPVTIKFTKLTSGGTGNFFIYIKYLTGDQVITSCQNQQVAVWTDFMQPDSYTFIDDYGDPFLGNSAPICVGYFNHEKQFVSSEVSFCLDHDRQVASVAWWYYPGQVIYTHNSNPNHDIDRTGTYDEEDQLKKARLLWITANAPVATKPQQLAVQIALWATLDNPTNHRFSSGTIARQAQQAVPSLPGPTEPDFSIEAGNLGTLGSPVNYKLNFDIAEEYPARVKLVVPDGLTIDTVAGNGIYNRTTGFIDFTSLPGSVDITVFSSEARVAKIAAVYEEDNFWNIYNLEVYNSCNSNVQDFVGLSRRNMIYPYREAAGIWSSPLPVTLLNFDVHSEGENVNLTWKTVVEDNSHGFEIQRSDDAVSWQSLGFVAAKSGGAHVTSQLSYNFSDTDPLNGVSYYRLKMVDLDETFTYSQIRALERKSRPVYIYPNPVVDGKLNINTGDENFYRAEVYNMTGAAVASQNLGRSRELDVSRLATGIYVLCIISTNGDVKTNKFVIK